MIDNKLYFFTDVELSKLELTGHAYDCYMHDVQLHSYIYFLVRAPIINQLHGHLILLQEQDERQNSISCLLNSQSWWGCGLLKSDDHTKSLKP